MAYSPNFERAFIVVVGVEGGYVNNPADPGGETKFGLSKRANPDLDIRSLTLDQAKQRYAARYWLPEMDSWEYGKALLYFDCLVNGGHPQRWHDMYAGFPLKEFAVAFQAEHLLYLAALPTWPTFGRGWARRALTIFHEATS